MNNTNNIDYTVDSSFDADIDWASISLPSPTKSARVMSSNDPNSSKHGSKYNCLDVSEPLHNYYFFSGDDNNTEGNEENNSHDVYVDSSSLNKSPILKQESTSKIDNLIKIVSYKDELLSQKDELIKEFERKLGFHHTCNDNTSASFEEDDNTNFSYHVKLPDDIQTWVDCLPFICQFEILRLYQTNELTSDMIQNIRCNFTCFQSYEKVDLYGGCIENEEDCQFLCDLLSAIYRESSTISPIDFTTLIQLINSTRYTLDVNRKYSSNSSTNEGAIIGDTNISTISNIIGGSSFYFSAQVSSQDDSTRFNLLPPERAFNRRIYRKFGSHRFLHVSYPQREKGKLPSNFILCNRKYSYLWAKNVEQIYIFFAESGEGILSHQEITVREVRNWSISSKLNPSLSIGKELKRMKLSFSKTEPTLPLPASCVELIDDIYDVNSNIRTDGCGLISKEALNYIWYGYCFRKRQIDLYHNEDMDDRSDMDDIDFVSNDHKNCPWTSFQGRLGGFKGIWVLDDSLGLGIKVLCRKSQYKYECPMKSRAIKTSYTLNDYDEDFFDAFDICSWDMSPQQGHLSIRHVQILESRGVPLQYFDKLASQHIDYLDDNLKDSSSVFNYFNQIGTQTNGECDDGSSISISENLRMLSSYGLYSDEPYFMLMMLKFREIKLSVLRDKAKYRLGTYLRLIPDHVGLLKEGEVFMALGSESLSWRESAITYVVAMRNPAYFQSDMCKLRVVFLETLYERANGDVQSISFYKNLRVGLVLNVKGPNCLAQRMSGGDFDGDYSWVCWDENVVSHVGDCKIQDTTGFKPQQAEEETVSAFTQSNEDRMNFVRHYCSHQKQLGRLSLLLDKALDYYGFEHEVSLELGKQAFLQVDHPYYTWKIPFEMNSIPDPHWFSSRSNNITSTKTLGHLWTKLNNAINNESIIYNTNNLCYERNEFILKFIHQHEQRSEYDFHKVYELKLLCENEYKNYRTSFAKFSNKDDVHKAVNFHKIIQEQIKEKLFDTQTTTSDKDLAAAILYSVWKVGHSLPWKVAPDRLGSIILQMKGEEFRVMKKTSEGILRKLFIK